MGNQGCCKAAELCYALSLPSMAATALVSNGKGSWSLHTGSALSPPEPHLQKQRALIFESLVAT